MKFLLIAFTFFAGVYLGLNTGSDGELNRAMEQIQALIGVGPEWEVE